MEKNLQYKPRVSSDNKLHRPFWPEVVYVTEEAKNDPLTQRVISRLNQVKIVEISGESDPLSAAQIAAKNLEATAQGFSVGKRRLLLTRYKGNWLKSCPGTSQHVCCNLWIVNPGEGCPLDCTYCYLQSYLLRNPTLKIYSNISEMKDTIATKANEEPNRLFRIGTGELIDSLVWDELTDLSLELVPLFAKIPNITLELKTKFDFVDNLLSLEKEHQGKTVISWSVNAKRVSENDEAQTATIEERLRAAEKVAAAGYRVGFHFDPLIHFEGWEDEYRDLVAKIFARIPVKSIAWVSVSSLRYKPEMHQIMQIRFPNSKLPLGEHFLAKDGKLRYIQPLRFKMLDFLWKELKAVDNSLPVYMCMESSAAWRNIAGGPPVAGSELVEIFSRSGRLNVLS